MKSSHPKTPAPRLLVVGAGFLGSAVARLAKAGGWGVTPIVRSETSAKFLASEFSGVKAVDALRETFWECLGEEWHGLVWSMSPTRGQESKFHDLHQRGAQLAAGWAKKRALPMVYLSSTSVYAESGGGWVEENSPLAREDERSMSMVNAEGTVLDIGGSVLRCAGIYGPGRELRETQEGPERWLNVVHVEDAARAVGMVLGQKGEIYNLCEDEPIRRGTPGGDWPAGRRQRRSKRVRNAKLRGLGWQPRWKAGCPHTI